MTYGIVITSPLAGEGSAFCVVTEKQIPRAHHCRMILLKLAEGAGEDELLQDYPHIAKEDIRAAVAYGAASVAHEEVVLLENQPLTNES